MDEQGRRVPRMRRRSNLPKGQKRHVHQVTLDEAQEARLMALAAELGKRPAAALVELLEADRGETPTDRNRQGAGLLQLHRELSGAAVNMNQVAKKANTTHEIPSNFGATMEALRLAAQRVDAGVQMFITERQQSGRGGRR